MKYTFPFFIAFILTACKTTEYKKPWIEISKPFTFPDTAHVRNNLFFDKTEISNLDYQKYIEWLSLNFGDNSAEFANAKPQFYYGISRVKGKLYLHNDYSSSGSYFFHPISGISYEQAVNFCKWRTHIVNRGNYIANNSIKTTKPDTILTFPIRIIYRLPTKTEWEFAAYGNLTNGLGYDYQQHDNLNPYFNTLERKNYIYFETVKGMTNDTLVIPDEWIVFSTPSMSYSANAFGLYDMIGNVAEMVAEKGLAKGGSYNHSLDSSVINLEIAYSSPHPWLGFRCVCETLDKDSLSSTLYHAINGDSLKIRLSNEKNKYKIYLTDIKNVTKFSDLFQLENGAQIKQFEMVIVPKIGNVLSDVSKTDEFSELDMEWIRNINSGTVLAFMNITIEWHGETKVIEGIWIEVIR